MFYLLFDKESTAISAQWYLKSDHVKKDCNPTLAENKTCLNKMRAYKQQYVQSSKSMYKRNHMTYMWACDRFQKRENLENDIVQRKSE